MNLNTHKKEILKFSTIVLAVVVLLSFLIYKRSNYNFTIVFTSEVASRVDQYLGYAGLSTVIKDIEKKEGRSPLVFDAGGAFTGSIEISLTDGMYIVNILNAIGYSAMGIGNIDFSYSKPVLKKILDNLSFPVVNTNVLNEKGEHEFLSSSLIPHRINLFKTLHIGVISLLTPTTKERNLPSTVEGLEFSSSLKLVQDEVNKLKKKADFIVLLSQLNLESNRFSSFREKSGFYLEKVLATVKGIDIVIAGQVNLTSLYDRAIEGVPVFFTSNYLKYIGVLNIKKSFLKKWDIDSNGVQYEHSTKNNIEPDPKMVKFLEKLNLDVRNKFYTVVGFSNQDIPLQFPKIRQEQTPLGRLLVDISKKDKDVDIAIMNAGAIREGIKKGDITARDLFLIFPFKNKLISVEITGQELIDILERSYSFYPNLFAGFLQLSSNIDLKLDLNNPPGNRISNINISGKNLDKNKKYKILLPDFLKEGGDGYTIFKDKKVIEEFGDVQDVLKNYIKDNSPISF